MEKEYFSLDDKIEEIKSRFIQKGWIKSYENSSKGDNDSSGIYCYLVKQNQKEQIAENYSWPFLMGHEGKPTVYEDNSYQSNDEDKVGIEPFDRTIE